MKLLDFEPPAHWLRIRTIEMHTGGEPLRVLVDGLPEIPGDTILAKRRWFRDHCDHLRRGTMFEPRGHADMYGAIITESVTPDGDFGVFFLHNEGYSTMCGHATIALAKLAAETGLVKDAVNRDLRIDAPPGRLLARPLIENGRVTGGTFHNVPSFVLASDQSVDIPDIGRVRFDIAYGGAFYAFCEAEPLDLNLDGSDYERLIRYGKEIKHAVMTSCEIKHPFEDDLSFLYGVIFIGPARGTAHHSRNVCVFADGEVDRSATGSGVSARAAIHHARDELVVGETITVESILGTTMDVRVIEKVTYGPHAAIVPEVSGHAYFTGRHEFWFDPDDPLREGFIFR
ncbi:MAG: proline racemase family protein [Candidatus Latescibacterota bacterium]|nr:MAG: proline racemase family protein [Candidatus Latescibacterota bacterium]